MVQDIKNWWIIILLFVLLIPLFLVFIPIFPWSKNA